MAKDRALIDAAKAAAETVGADMMVLVYIKGEQIGMASYGRDRVLCDEAGSLGDYLFDEAGMYCCGLVSP